jgi:uncharacterized protein (DUF1697 family)
MPVYISMLRGINVGPHNRIKMDALRALYNSLSFEDPRTYVQSGNVIFRTKEKNTATLAAQIQQALEKKLKCSPAVILRTTAEMKRSIAANPFAARRDIEPGKLLVTFLSADPATGAQSIFDKFKDYPEELHLIGRELYIYFPNGAGKSKLPWSQVEKLLKVTGTARNWNSVTKMYEMAEAMEE